MTKKSVKDILIEKTTGLKKMIQQNRGIMLAIASVSFLGAYYANGVYEHNERMEQMSKHYSEEAEREQQRRKFAEIIEKHCMPQRGIRDVRKYDPRNYDPRKYDPIRDWNKRDPAMVDSASGRLIFYDRHYVRR